MSWRSATRVPGIPVATTAAATTPMAIASTATAETLDTSRRLSDTGDRRDGRFALELPAGELPAALVAAPRATKNAPSIHKIPSTICTYSTATPGNATAPTDGELNANAKSSGNVPTPAESQAIRRSDSANRTPA
ncbi:unannotated protein [freshwater metagenome]|uniref:Unannotated protein n=1 Tax=freshwater metagenome TaxID=449393 RepID=A0A6J6EFA1_9ZZZZ